jgi:hypothetical protein
MEELFLGLLQANPAVASCLASIGLARLIFKPIMIGVEAYVSQSPSKSDDEKLAKVKANKFYKAFAFILDYAASIKLPK